jgi:hypothetical protein
MPAAEGQEPPAGGGVLVIVDGTGKEHKIKAWKFSAGTRHLSWLAPAAAEDPKEKLPAKPAPSKARPPAGPEALEFREEHSTTFKEGVLTLVPLSQIKAIEYDEVKKSVLVKYLNGDGKEDTLSGTTKYIGINRFTLEAEVDKGDMGIAEVKFLGGAAKGGIRSAVFPESRTRPPALVDKPGRSAAITIAEKPKLTHKVADLKALYRMADGSERILATIMFKKTLKVNLDQVEKIHVVDNAKGDDGDWVVTFKGGEEQGLTLLKTAPLDDRPALLLGFIARVSAGWRLYPPHTITDIVFEEEKKD